MRCLDQCLSMWLLPEIELSTRRTAALYCSHQRMIYLCCSHKEWYTYILLTPRDTYIFILLTPRDTYIFILLTPGIHIYFFQMYLEHEWRFTKFNSTSKMHFVIFKKNNEIWNHLYHSDSYIGTQIFFYILKWRTSMRPVWGVGLGWVGVSIEQCAKHKWRKLDTRCLFCQGHDMKS